MSISFWCKFEVTTYRVLGGEFAESGAQKLDWPYVNAFTYVIIVLSGEGRRVRGRNH